MTKEQVQRAISSDGTEIAARVHGTGPPLVLSHGAFADGETGWIPLLPELTDRFTCYAMSTQGRGLSTPSGDPSPDRRIDEVASLVESIGEPAPVFGLSSGAFNALGAAERTSAISAVIAYEPPVFEIMDEEVSGQFNATFERVAEQAAAGRPVDAVNAFLPLVANDEELASVTELGLPDMLAPNVEVQLQELAAFNAYDGPLPTYPDQLAKIQAPLLLLHGTRSVPNPWFRDSIRHVADHVRSAQVKAVEGAGHLAPIVRPSAIAAEIEAFLTDAA